MRQLCAWLIATMPSISGALICVATGATSMETAATIISLSILGASLFSYVLRGDM